MKKLLIPCILLFIANTVSAQHRLDIEINEFKNDNGMLMLQLLDENQNIIAQKKENIVGKNCKVSFMELKPGKYAVRYYQDENLNGRMDTNLVGKPLEGYGFSNNVTGKFGPPPFEKWLFVLDADKKILLKPTF